MSSLCGADCKNCQFGKDNGCKGCKETCGKPFGKDCFVAKYILTGGMNNFEEFKKTLIDEINALSIPGMVKISDLYPINGSFVNVAYPMPNGKNEKLLSDGEMYLCNQVEIEFNDSDEVRCYGIAANMNMILVGEYGANCNKPELVIYKRR